MTSSSDAVLGALAAGVNHALANRLATVRLLADLLDRRADLPEDVRAQLGHLSTAAAEAADLTQRLGAFAGRRRGPAVEQDVTACVTELAPLLAAALGRRPLEVEVEVAGAPAVARCDRAALEELLARLALAAAGQPAVRVRVDDGAGPVVISVGSVDAPVDAEELDALAAAAGAELRLADGSAAVVVPRA